MEELVMHVRRIASTALLTVTLVVSYSARAEDDNPFAKWEQQQRQLIRQKQSSEKKSAGSKVEYFSADAATGTPSSKKAEPAVKRERLQSATKSSPAAEKTDQATSRVGKPFPLTPERMSRKPSEQQASSDRVTMAAFGTKEAKKQVRQVSGEAANPFAEFFPDDASGEATAFDPEVEFSAAPDADDVGPFSLPEKDVLPQRTKDVRRLPPALDGAQTPSVTLRWEHHDEFTIGQKCRCDLVVANTGRSPVRDVTTEVILPRGLQVVGAEPAPTTAGETARWSYDQLDPGESRTIKLTVIPRQSGDVHMNAFVQLTGAASSAVSITQPDVAIKLEGPETVEVGQQVGYTVHVTNPGTGTAKNVVIQAAVPDGLEHRQGRLLTIEIGTLSPGELRRARLSLTAVAGGDQKLAIRVLAEGDVSEQITQMIAVAEPKLNIGLRGPKTRKTGQDSDFELVVVNEGNVESNNVRAKYKVPEGFEFVRADAGGKFSPQDQTIEWFVGTLEPNRVRQYRVTLRATKSGNSHHQVGVISEHGKMTMAEHDTTVEGNAELALNVAVAADQVREGEKTIFEIRIENNGTTAANSVGLSCELPAGMELLDVSGPSEFIADNGVIIFRSMPALEPGKSAVFAVSTRCRRAGKHRLRARVASESIGEPLIGEGTTVGLDR